MKRSVPPLSARARSLVSRDQTRCNNLTAHVQGGYPLFLQLCAARRRFTGLHCLHSMRSDGSCMWNNVYLSDLDLHLPLRYIVLSIINGRSTSRDGQWTDIAVYQSRSEEDGSSELLRTPCCWKTFVSLLIGLDSCTNESLQLWNKHTDSDDLAIAKNSHTSGFLLIWSYELEDSGPVVSTLLVTCISRWSPVILLFGCESYDYDVVASISTHHLRTISGICTAMRTCVMLASVFSSRITLLRFLHHNLTQVSWKGR